MSLNYNNETSEINISLVEILRQRAQYQPDKQAYIFLQNGETESGTITYGELDRQARAIASQLESWRGDVISFWIGVYYGFLWLFVCWSGCSSGLSSQTQKLAEVENLLGGELK